MEHYSQEPQNLDLIARSLRTVGCELGNSQIEQLSLYVAELLKWNKKSNLTGFGSEKDVIGNLIADSLAAYSLVDQKTPCSIMDIGTGGGIPGILLKIAIPTSRLTLVEPNHKKVAFLHLIAGTLGLKKVNIIASRIQQVKNDDQYHGIFDWIVIKALRLEMALPYVKNVLSHRGHVICWRSETMKNTPELYGFQVNHEVSYQLPFGMGQRILSVLGL